MATGNEEIRTPIAIPVETNATDAATSVQALRDQIAASKDAIKATAGAMRDLRGSTSEVKAAKDELRSKLEAEKKALSDATLKLTQQGKTYDQVAAKAKASAAAEKERSGAIGRAITAAGGPIASIKEKVSSLTEALGGAEGGLAAVAGVAAIAAAAIAVAGAAAVGAISQLARFILVSADASRLAHLTRKGHLAGNESWAKQLGEQVDEITRKIPVARERVDELAFALARSRIGGQTMVDALNAIAGASSAVGDELGNKLRGIIERGALTRRMQLSPQELMGMDLDFSDVAKAYAEGMNISVAAARAALFEGRVRLQDGAAALKRAVDAKFGEINGAKLSALGNIARKAKEDLAGLAKDVNIEPVLKGIKQLASNLDASTVNGKALRGIITTIGNSLGLTFTDGVGSLQHFVDYSVYAALTFENVWLRAKLAWKDLGAKTSLETTIFTHSINIAFHSARGLATALEAAVDAVKALRAAYSEFVGSGEAVTGGVGQGIQNGKLGLLAKVRDLARDVKKSFDDPLEIRSPSRKMFKSGKDGFTGGLAGGIKAGKKDVDAAVSELVPEPPKLGAGGARGGTPVVIHYNPQIIVQGGAGADVREQLRDPSLLQALTENFLAMLRAGGFEVPG